MKRVLWILPLFLLLWVPLSGAASAPTDSSSGFPSPSPLSSPYPIMRPPTLLPKITFDAQTRLFTYTYQLINNPSSTANIDRFQMDIARRNLAPLERVDFYNNPTAEGTNSYVSDVNRVQAYIIPVAFVAIPTAWGAGIGVDQSVYLSAPSVALAGTDTSIHPGQTAQFILISKGFPGARFFSVRQAIDLDAVAFPGGNAILAGAWFQGPTVGPSSTPVGCTTPDCLIGFLATHKDQALTLGWIDNQGVANSLDQKLANARTAAQDGNLNAAGNLLHAFLNELSAQHGKHVNDSAYFMLAPSAEYILSQMAVH